MGFVAIEPQLARKLASQGRQRGLANREHRKDQHLILGAGLAERRNQLLDVVADVDDDTW